LQWIKRYIIKIYRERIPEKVRDRQEDRKTGRQRDKEGSVFLFVCLKLLKIRSD
jgi:hypothetical protein